jgi:hypothetical protein
MGIGKDQSFSIEAEFPPTLLTSSLGLGMSEDQLQQRCYLLNKWMQNIFNNYHLFPEKAQVSGIFIRLPPFLDNVMFLSC